MKRAICCWLLIAASGHWAAADETWSSGVFSSSRLATDDAIQTLQEPLAQLLPLKIEAGQLKIDRAAQKQTAKEIEQYEATNPDARIKLPVGFVGSREIALVLLAKSQERVDTERKWEAKMVAAMGQTPPLGTLFRHVQDTATEILPLVSGGLPGYSWHSGFKQWQWAFQTERLIGRLRSDNDGECFDLKETKWPSRSFRWEASGDLAYRIQYGHRDGDLVLLRQNNQGKFSLVIMIGKKTFSQQADSFVELVRQRREPIDTMLQALTSLGICPLSPINWSDVRDATVASIFEVGGMRDEASQLFDALAGTDAAARDVASTKLSDKYLLFKDAILEKLFDQQTTAELRTRLQHILDQQPKPTKTEQTVAALALANNPEYVVTLLDNASESKVAKLTGHLQRLTGESYGDNVDAWKQWARKKQSEATIVNQQTRWTESLLDRDGELQKQHEDLAALFEFKIDVGQLKNNRTAWKRRASVFQSIQNRAKTDGARFTTSGGGENASFAGERLAGRLEMSPTWSQLELSETAAPNRTLTISNDNDTGFLFQLSNSKGDLFLLRQVTSGPFQIIALCGETSFADQAESFSAFYKRHQQLMDSHVLPALEKIGLAPKQAISTAQQASRAGDDKME